MQQRSKGDAHEAHMMRLNREDFCEFTVIYDVFAGSGIR